jgi:5'-phosphate synthase pdxT subunit
MATTSPLSPLVGVLALQGAFEEHQACLHAIGCRTIQVRTVRDMEGIDGIVLPGGESTAMGLIGVGTVTPDGKTMWDALKEFSAQKPTWGTCAGMILLAEKCVGASAVIENGQSLVGGIDILVCRNYFGSQVSSFQMGTKRPPGSEGEPYPGVFIRAPAILSAGPDVTVLGTVVATPCRQAAVVLRELERKIKNGENVVMMEVVDALERKSQGIDYIVVVKAPDDAGEEKKDVAVGETEVNIIELPGAADGTNAREVISAVRKDHLLCTAFHPELTKDYRWHEYFVTMVRESMA